MKNYLLRLSLVAITVIALCSGVKYFADLTVNGSIIKTDPTYTGTFKISQTLNGQTTFETGFPGPGVFMVVGQGNGVDFGTQALTALYRGATFSANVGGSVSALTTQYGNDYFNQYSGFSFFGQNVPNDGFSGVQIKGGLKTDSLRLANNPGATGDVLTRQSDGSYRPATPSGGTLPPSGTYIPTTSSPVNISSSNGSPSTWVLNNKVLTLHINVGLTAIANNTITSFKVTLPAGYTIWSGSVYKGTGDYAMNSGTSGYVAAVADAIGSSDATHVKLSFYPTTAAGTSGDATFNISFLIP